MKKQIWKSTIIVVTFFVLLLLRPSEVNASEKYEKGAVTSGYFEITDDNTLVYHSGYYGYYDGAWRGLACYTGDKKSSIKKVIIQEGAHFYGSLARMFDGFSALETVDFSLADFHNATSFDHMFWDCYSLSSVDLTGLDFSNVTTMYGMFRNCRSLTAIDFSGLYIPKVNSFAYMFYGCNSLERVTFSEINTNSVTSMSSMFQGCSALISLDMSGVDTSNVKYMSSMFCGCSSLTSLDLSWIDTSSVTGMASMFLSCSSLQSIDLSYFDTSSVIDMSEMFKDCSSLEELDLSCLDISNLESMYWMFWGCSALETLNLSGLDARKVQYMQNMFRDCTFLKEIDFSGFKTFALTDMSDMFYGCKSLKSIDLSGFDTHNVTSISWLFQSCDSLKTLNLNGLDLSNVKDLSFTFSLCRSLETLNLTGVRTAATDLDGMFNGCNKLTELDLLGFDTTDVTTMANMFSGCSSLTSLDLSSFKTSNVRDMSGMFSYCSQLTVLDISNFNMEREPNTNTMFAYCSNLAAVYLPESITLIGENAFYKYSWNSKLTDVYYAGTIDDWNNITVESGNEALQTATIHYDCHPAVITCQPESKAVREEKIAVFSVVTSGLITSYQWQYKIKGKNTWYNCSTSTIGYNSSELQIVGTLARDGYMYRCKITDFRGKTITSNAALLTVVENVLEIVMQPQSATVVEGRKAVFFIGAEGKGITYQWQYKMPKRSTWYNCSSNTEGYNLPNLRVVGTLARNGFQYRCVVTDAGGNEAVSVAVLLTVNENPAGVSITGFSVEPVVIEAANNVDGFYDVMPDDMVIHIEMSDGKEFSGVSQDIFDAMQSEYQVIAEFLKGGTDQSEDNLWYEGEVHPAYLTVGIFKDDVLCSECDTTYQVLIVSELLEFVSFVVDPVIFEEEDSTYYDVAPDDMVVYVELSDGNSYYGERRDFEFGPWNMTLEVLSVESDQSESNHWKAGTHTAILKAGLSYAGIIISTVDVEYDVIIVAKSGMEIREDGTLIFHAGDYSDRDSWYLDEESRGGITAVIAEEGAVFSGDISYIFQDYYQVESIELSKADFSAVTSMEGMFSGCQSLTNLEISDIDTSNVTNMSIMFDGCSSLSELDLSGFNTSNVTDMSDMFWGCGNLITLDISSFDMSAVADTSLMFSYCSKLESVQLPSSITIIGLNAFSYCASLSDVYYAGSETDWGEVSINDEDEGNTELLNATIHYDCVPITIIEQPKSQVVTEEKTAVFSVKTTGTVVSYRWQYKINGKNTWYNSTANTEGYNTSELNVIGALARNGYMYRCILTDFRGNAITSDAAVLTVNESIASITSQPQSQTVEEEETAVFNIEAEGIGLTYCWQYKIAGTGKWRNCSFGNEAELQVVGILARNGYQYRCIVEDEKGNTATSAAALLTVTKKTVKITDQPSDSTVEEDDTAHFTLAASGNGLSYQWQYKIAGTTKWRNCSSNTAGYNSSELQVVGTLARNGYQYRCIVTDEDENVAISDSALLTVVQRSFSITSDPQNQTVPVGEMAYFTVAATGDGLTYQWQYKAAGSGTWRNSSSATTGYNSAELEVVGTAARNGFQYRCKVTDENGETVTSKPATLTVE